MELTTTSRRISRRTGLAALGATVALTLAACGSGDDGVPGADDTGSGDGATTPISVGVIPILDVAPIYLGVEKGFFEEQGLDVTLEPAQGGAAIIPGVTSGQYQFGFSNTTSLLLATDKELGVKVVASGNQATDDPAKDMAGILVPADSDITGPKDLAGKKVAVNTLNNINTTTINKLVRDAGGDPSGIEYVELAFPDIPAAVASGDVDAGQVVEPFVTVGTGQGMTNIGSNYAGVEPGLQVAMYFTSTDYAEQNPDVVEKFTTAMTESLSYAQEHEDETRAVLLTYTKIDEEASQKVVLPQFGKDVDTESVQLLADLGTEDGLFGSAPDLSVLLP
ncbi:ABC transporter substrate-binding protein [Phycicoccus sp. CSK15P-2]|uniref:ABC transporter substrate-binding protein n=1 Tax=Phycicoccus sp. CSK15P-2 TaxID=2807627 RepID=UPI00194FDF23|nr:ABC transporter substrate-binding protein [Phycicoccus sp. CSK15P-2]MBM6403188.1 ABC transporter substrate-binding protein [Phycicoccus sp. CSK15P-2]